ncbi:MAG: hypothetical protein RLP44_26820 [Aggregatilineales bacterium]
MRLKFSSALATAITISVGFLTVIGLLLGDRFALFEGFAGVFLQLTTITIALTIIIGIINLLSVHVTRVGRRKSGAIYSLVLVVSFTGVIVSYAVDRDTSMMLLETVQISVESALAGLLFFALVYGAYRMMRHHVSGWNLLFISAVLLVLLGSLPLSQLEPITEVRDWVLSIPVNAGARGLLMGVALATVVAGMRVLIGQDRSYRE